MEKEYKDFTVVRIIDDDPEQLESYKYRLDAEGWFVRCYTSAENFLEHDNFNVPGCAIIDIRMGGMSGLELYEVLKTRKINLPVIFLTAHGTIDLAVSTLQSGAVSFLTKPASQEVLNRELRKAVLVSLNNCKRQDKVSAFKELTPKEKVVAKLVAQGLLNKQIAFELNTSERTVLAHRSAVYQKLNAKNAIDVYKILHLLQEVD